MQIIHLQKPLFLMKKSNKIIWLSHHEDAVWLGLNLTNMN